VEAFIFGNLRRVVHQIQREAQAAAHFIISRWGFAL
jgi:hypothetical protein